MAATTEESVTYWLMPAEPARSFFITLISDLAARFDAPLFEPHLTVYATKKENENEGELLRRVLPGHGASRLLVRGINFSDDFTKTVFVTFESKDQLTQLKSDLRHFSQFKNDYQLNPHLSLIYQTIPREIKVEIANSVRLPFDCVLFDSVKAVISPVRVASRTDVEAWRVVATQRLSE